MKIDFNILESWSPEDQLHQQLCLRMREMKATLKQMKRLAQPAQKLWKIIYLSKVSPAFPSMQAADSLPDNLVVFLNDSLGGF